MAHGLNPVLKRSSGTMGCKSEGKTGIGSRRIFHPHFKLQVLDSYRNDADCKGNQRATARKYGIHRRQIQKWLQAENNLRNSVGKIKQENSNISEVRKCGIEVALRGRQQDDLDAFCQSGDARVPAISPVAYAEGSRSPFTTTLTTSSAPLDFTTHSRSYASPLVASPAPTQDDSSIPIDLSIKRPPTPVYFTSSSPLSQVSSPPAIPRSPVTLTCLTTQEQPDVWDLSTKSNKRKYEESLCSPNSTTSSSSTSQPSKPIKLFKPYLDNVKEACSDDEIKTTIKVEDTKIYECIPAPLTYETTIDTCFNNNNIYTNYTLHELQPTKAYYFNTLSKYPLYTTPECDINSPYCAYEETNLLELSPPLKQRQSYSLDFKLSAIECYYQDEYCRGNQRAVANKYNIHRRQVQKWLKQEEELRQRNESVKQLNVFA